MKRYILLSACIVFYSNVFSQTNTFPTSGNVGIGTTSPSFPLTVSGKVYTNQGFFVSGYNTTFANQGGYMMWNLTTGVGETDFVNNQGLGIGGFQWYNTPPSGSPLTEIMALTGSGNLGIGTTSPDYKLTISGTSIVLGVDNQSVFAAKNSGGSYETFLWPRWSDNVMYLNYGSGGFNIRNNSSSPTMFMTNSGNVLIGKTSQTNTSYKLDVNGNIRANQVTVNATGADYVFDPKYKLPSIDSLSEYIKAHHHLPGIPSAKEMQKSGMNLGNVYTKLLEKMEEMTKYMIEQEKMIQKQQNEITGMKRKIFSLERNSQ